MKRYGKLYQEAEITLSNNEWNGADKERVFSEAETLLFEKIGRITDAVDINGKIDAIGPSVIFLATYHNNGTCEFYPGEHNFDGKQEDISEVNVTDPEDDIQEQLSLLGNRLDCDISFLTVSKEWKED